MLEALSAGRIDKRKAGVIVTDTTHLSVAHARTVTDRILEDAETLTTGQLRARIRKTAIETDPDSVREQHKKAVTDRQFVSWTQPDGTIAVQVTGIDPLRGQELLISPSPKGVGGRQPSRQARQRGAFRAAGTPVGSPATEIVHEFASLTTPLEGPLRVPSVPPKSLRSWGDRHHPPHHRLALHHPSRPHHHLALPPRHHIHHQQPRPLTIRSRRGRRSGR
ncbi:MAG: hypothetical protein ACLGHX_10555 [Acidimicrobiia bacterium]